MIHSGAPYSSETTRSPGCATIAFLALLANDIVIWFGIGLHDNYERLGTWCRRLWRGHCGPSRLRRAGKSLCLNCFSEAATPLVGEIATEGELTSGRPERSAI
jgi:hypothetical protein